MRWTLEEDQIVLACVKQALEDGGTVSAGVRDASRQIDRAYMHIQTRWYQRLRYQVFGQQRARTNPRCWTAEEEGALRESVIAARKAGFSERSAVKDAAEQIGRSKNAALQRWAAMRARGLL